jgi:hypothetical protein
MSFTAIAYAIHADQIAGNHSGIKFQTRWAAGYSSGGWYFSISSLGLPEDTGLKRLIRQTPISTSAQKSPTICRLSWNWKQAVVVVHRVVSISGDRLIQNRMQISFSARRGFSIPAPVFLVSRPVLKSVISS